MSLHAGIRSGLRNGLRSGLNPGGAPAGFTTWTLEKTGGVHIQWDAEAYSNETFLGTTVLAFVLGPNNGQAIGLSADNPDADYTTIDFALLNDGGTMYRSENGALTLIGATVPGDEWTVTRTAGTGAVTFHQNGALVSTATGTSLAALRVDSSFRFTTSTIEDVTVTNGTLQVLTFTTNGVTATGS